jgi:putative transposase
MNEVLSRFGLSARRFCRLTGWNRSSLQYRPEGRDDAALRERLRYLAARKPRWGAPILPDVLKAEGLVINHKRTERLYREEGLSLRRKGRRKLPAVARVSLSVPQGPNERWSRDLIHDQLATGRRFRCLTLVNDFTRQCLAIHVDTSIGGISVVAVLQRLALSGRLPKAITVGQWSRVHRQSPPPLGSTLRRYSSSYPSGQTDAERLHRELQWYLARRLPQPALV